MAWDATTLQATHVTRFVGKQTQSVMPREIRDVYAQALDREIGETLCVLYVALTRAKHALYLITNPRMPNAKGQISHLKTYGGLLHAALVGNEPMPPDSIVYACGDPEWYRQLPQHTPALTEPREVAPNNIVQAIRLAPPLAHHLHGLETVAPSSLEGGARAKLDLSLAPERTFALNYGTLIHAWFESIEWLETTEHSADNCRSIAERFALLDRSELPQAIDDFLRMIKIATITQLLTRATYESLIDSPWPQPITNELSRQPIEWEVRREVRIVSPDGDRILMGNIDRLVLAKRNGRTLAAEIIDFKTDQIPEPAELAKRVAYYRPQIQAYRRAIGRMLRLSKDRVAARLVFVQQGEIVTVD